MSFYYPSSEKEARALTRRKLKSIKNHAEKLLYEAAGYWEEGVVSGSVDICLEDLRRNLEGIEDAMGEQMQISQEREE